jgi:RHS repeat-associated protein
MKIKVQTYYTKFAENYFSDNANNFGCNNNGIELPAEIRNLPNLRQVYADALQQGNHDKLYYFNANHLGSGSLITDGGGNTYQTLAYAPYGEGLVDITHSSSGSYDERFRFNGKPKDTETGFYNHGARQESPEWSIWTSPDSRWDLYPNRSSYSMNGNNPILYVDLDGRKILDWRKTVVNTNGKVIGGFRNEGALKEFNSTITTLYSKNSSIFHSVVDRLRDSKELYSVYQDYDWSLSGHKGRYHPTTRRIEFFAEDISESTIFEEFFHAAQHDFYKENRLNILDEFEAKIAKIISAHQTGNQEIIGSDGVLSSISDIDKWIIVLGLVGGANIDEETLNTSLANVKNSLIDVYGFDKNSKLDYNKSLEYLKTLIKSDEK